MSGCNDTLSALLCFATGSPCQSVQSQEQAQEHLNIKHFVPATVSYTPDVLTAISTDLERLSFFFPFTIFLRVARGYFLFMFPAKPLAADC